jgi:TetR/AcrR family transcriptional repressor of bet genes
MPKLGMEPIRRDALVKAAIAEIGAAGSLDVTMGGIARRAGVSPALAHHYFGSKDALFLSAMRHILAGYGAAVRAALRGQTDPQARLRAIVRASFDADQFRPEVVAAWLNFYVQARTVPQAARLLAIYRGRLHSNLLHALRPLAASRADALAGTVGALIDGFYLRAGTDGRTGGADEVLDMVDTVLARAR